MVPGCFEAFALDAAFERLFLFEQIQGNAVEQGEVLGGMTGAFAVQVFAEVDIQHPVQFVFDAPVLANALIQPHRVGLEAGDVVADLALGLAGGLVVPLGLDAHQPVCRAGHQDRQDYRP